MLIDKEYPATHSMSTSWYIVDEEGNVGIMDFNANGPVPWGTEEACIEDLTWGFYWDKVLLTEEQILYMLGDSHEPKEDMHCRDYIIQIEPSRKDELEALCAKSSLEIEGCLSESLGLYQVDYDKNIEEFDDDTSPKNETLYELLSLIKNIYKKTDFYIDERYEKREMGSLLKF